MPSRRTILVLSILLLAGLPAAASSDWKPIDPAELALAQPKVDPSADAEAFVWDVRVADTISMLGEPVTTFDHYVRLKVFTDRGRDRFATVDLPYVSGVRIIDVAARTVRPDGATVELKKSDIFERTIVKADALKVKAVSFAVPGIETGAIVEYRWREEYRNSIAHNLRLRFSREIPIQTVRYAVKPLDVPGFGMVAWPFNGKFIPPEKQKDGYSVITLLDVPADRDEEYRLPPFEERPWVFISYEQQRRGNRDEFYRQFGKALHDEYERRSKPNDEIRSLASAAIEGRTTEAERITALVGAAREKVKRVDVDSATPEDRRKARDNKNAADALKRGVGTGDDVAMLFMALARAAGFDARAAASPSRADLFPRSVQPHPHFFGGRLVAVRSGDGWVFVDPANRHVEAGHLPWEYEDQKVVVADARDALFARTPLSPPAFSEKKRTGTFRLTEEGTLEGEVVAEYTGHWGTIFREQEGDQTAADREKDLRKLLTDRFPSAEVTNVRVEHVADTAGPYTNAYGIRIPGYAQRTGSRLFLQPSVFQKGVAAIFAPVERSAGIFFRFPWTERDEIRIELPPGYSLEDPERPRPIDAGTLAYEAHIAVQGGTHLVLRRTLTVGRQGALLFDASSYRPLRAFFDEVHRGDAHTLVLRRKDAQ